jgi:hypothetical protein
VLKSLYPATKETIMSTNRNVDQNTPSAPLPSEEQNAGANREPDKESQWTSTPTPDTTTSPTIKNN